VIGIRAGAHAAPDGYTILMATTGASVPANPGYDIIKDFAPIGLIASIPIMVQANPARPVNSLTDIVAMTKKEPGKLTVGTPPPPTLNYFGAELCAISRFRRRSACQSRRARARAHRHPGRQAAP
jgi:tripartite-type tricarboxylate transporter receptor subunit TctC